MFYLCVFSSQILSLRGRRMVNWNADTFRNLMIIHHWARKLKVGGRKIYTRSGKIIFQLPNQQIKISLQIKFQFSHTTFCSSVWKDVKQKASLFDRYPTFFTFFFTRVPLFKWNFSSLNNFISCFAFVVGVQKILLLRW